MQEHDVNEALFEATQGALGRLLALERDILDAKLTSLDADNATIAAALGASVEDVAEVWSEMLPYLGLSDAQVPAVAWKQVLAHRGRLRELQRRLRQAGITPDQRTAILTQMTNTTLACLRADLRLKQTNPTEG